MLVPERFKLADDDLIGHMCFALKHESINLQILSEVLRRIDKESMEAVLSNKPSGIYYRKLGFLWEHFNKAELNVNVPSTVRYAKIFDEKAYVTGREIKNPKWRIIFNGLGSLDYCPIVEKTERIEICLKDNILERVNKYLEEIGEVEAGRAIQWAYLSETESSYAIEGQKADSSKAERFVRILQHAHEDVSLTEEYLCDLQNEVVSNIFDHAHTYRTEQNWLSNGGTGALAVSYIPRSPDVIDELMQKFLLMANELPKYTNPVVAAALASFGFVYLHPFMDGNGRISRFFFHQQLCASGQMKNGSLLPVSAAMLAAEARYLSALESFSKPVRALWKIKWISGNDYEFTFLGSDAVYRYWDATPCVEFALAMAEEALDKHLRQEVNYLRCFDVVKRAVNKRFDVRDSTLHHLINGCLDLNGVVSKNLRKKYMLQVDDAVFDFIEEQASKAIVEFDLKDKS